MAETSEKKYRVIPLHLSGMGKKIFRNGEIVTAGQVAVNGRSIEQLIKDGFIEEMDAKSEKKKATSEKKSEAPKKDEPEKEPIFTTNDGKAVFDIEDCTKNEIKAELTKRGIDFESKENKNALFQKL